MHGDSARTSVWVRFNVSGGMGVRTAPGIGLLLAAASCSKREPLVPGQADLSVKARQQRTSRTHEGVPELTPNNRLVLIVSVERVPIDPYSSIGIFSQVDARVAEVVSGQWQHPRVRFAYGTDAAEELVVGKSYCLESGQGKSLADTAIKVLDIEPPDGAGAARDSKSNEE